MISNTDKLYGSTTVGARGQVVIPSEARKDLNIKPGDQLLVMGKFGRLIGMIKLDELHDFLSFFSESETLDEQSKKVLSRSHRFVHKLMKNKPLTKKRSR
ncbi:MAG: AbrB/MazE/SpoVT family DNA-binding domain-containing protein [Candidatus Saccharibacteria bacterium]